MKPFTIDKAFDRRLLGAALGDAAPWQTWRIVLKAAFALPLSDSERDVFKAIAGNRGLPLKRVRELWAVIGRRAGKSRMAAAIGVYLACFTDRKVLAPGEIGEVAIISASREQAAVVFKYILGFLKTSPVLRQEIEGTTATEVRLRGNVVLSTRAGNYRTVRGSTLLAAIIDEVAFLRDETSAYPDIETYRALLPALMTTQGLLIGISTPYRRIGLLHQKHRHYFGIDNDDVLVVQGPSVTFNPTLTSAQIERAIADDPEGATSEWEATFRSDIAAFLDDVTIETAVDRDRPLELPPRAGIRYSAFCDPSGGRHDAFTLCIGHSEGQGENEYVVADVVRGVRPPFDPHAVVRDYAALAKEYRCLEVRGDRYSAEWVVTAFKDAGLQYRPAEKSKSELYLEMLPMFTRGGIIIPDYAPLLRELRLLERQAHRGGRYTVGHPRNGSDDFSNALAGAASLAKNPGYDWTGAWISGPDRDVDPKAEADANREWRRQQLLRYCQTGGFTRPW